MVQDRTFVFDRFTLITDQRMLLKEGQPVSIPPKAFDTLVFLVENAGNAVSKENLIASVWGGAFVEENNIAQNVSLLRRTLGKNKQNVFIETVSKFGYRFVAPIELAGQGKTEIHTKVRVFLNDAASPSEVRPVDDARVFGRGVNSLKGLSPETRYVLSGDANIAYQVVGDGPIDVVFVMGWISHLEYFWKNHLFASFLERLASFSRLILFDKRGTGLSDRVPLNELPTLEQRMEDVRAVMDAVGSERAVLIGISEGGPMCSLFAATYPERTFALVMIGTYAKRIWDKDYPWAPTEEQRQAFLELMRRDWGKPVGIEERAPSLATDPEFRDWWGTYLRMGASPGAAVALTKMNAEIDVRNVLPSIRVPTLVIHRSDDRCLKVEEGRFVASKISNCKFVELDGPDHLPFVGDQDSILDEIESFTRALPDAAIVDRVLATVATVSFGSELSSLDDVQRLVRRKLDLFRGQELNLDGSALVAAFDGPARCIRFVKGLFLSAGDFGSHFAAGIHTGECDVRDGSYVGYAVSLAALIALEAKAGQIIVSRTVKDLVAGSGITFAEAGIRPFRGFDEEWQLFEVIEPD